MVGFVVIAVLVSIGHKVGTTMLLARGAWSAWHLTAPKEDKAW
ncbi:hypothetical protein Javan638_0015 [Streptococcus phage Javan638]|nr:hypothetical protein Javan638_0015 [Streptococcus phage Javan638]